MEPDLKIGSKIIKAGTTCFVSTQGHNGFWYPIFSLGGMTEVSKDIEDPRLKTWVCGHDNLVAVEVEIDKIKDLYGPPTSKTIVWVDKKVID